MDVFSASNLAFPVAHLLVQPREVERGLVGLRVLLEFLDVLALGGREVSSFLGNERQVVMRQPAPLA